MLMQEANRENWDFYSLRTNTRATFSTRYLAERLPMPLSFGSTDSTAGSRRSLLL